jgi:hypothetical protein
MMKRLFQLLATLLVILNFSCDRERVEPIDIFATEELTSPVGLKFGNDEGIDKLIVNADRIIETPTGFHIKGTIFSESVSGTIPVTSGDFTVDTDGAGSASASAKGPGGIDFKGYGTASFPTEGLFAAKDVTEIPGSETWYNKGRIFKSEKGNSILPLLDEKYYFRHRIDNGKGKEYRMKKITVKLREYYLDARDPATLFAGDVYSEKAGAKKLIVENGAIGISANELWEFTPYKYSDNLEKITGGTGFEKMNGGISLTGIVPLKKYPLKILGRGVINTSFSQQGKFDFFERGFDDASFRIGVNGKLYFTNELVKFLSGTDTVSLGKATLQAEFSDSDFNIRLAGEYSDDILERFLGKTMMSYIPYNAREGVMYMKGSGNPDDFLIYVEEKISLRIPGLGVAPLANSTFRITKDQVGLSGTLTLPYNIGNVNVTGTVSRDGTFVLTGTTNCNVDLGSGLVYNANLDVEITEKGVKFKGAMTLPYGVGDVQVTGGLLIDEIYFGGTLKSAIPFPVNASVNSDLNVEISSKTGVKLNGSLSLPGGIGKVAVSGAINTTGLLLTGSISSGISVSFGNVSVRTSGNISVTASSNTGVILRGAVSLPQSLGNASATIRVTGSGLSMTGDLGSSINIAGAKLFNADMSVSASTNGGMWLSGQMQFPGRFGWLSVSGSVTDSSFSLSGDAGSFSLDFGIIGLSSKFSVSVTSWGGVKFSGSGKGSVGVGELSVSYTVGIDVSVDWSDNSVELCIDFTLGSACLDF